MSCLIEFGAIEFLMTFTEDLVSIKNTNLKSDIFHAIVITAKNAKQFEVISNNALLLVFEYPKSSFCFTNRTHKSIVFANNLCVL